MMIFFLTGRLTSLDFHIFKGVYYVIEPCVNDVFKRLCSSSQQQSVPDPETLPARARNTAAEARNTGESEPKRTGKKPAQTVDWISCLPHTQTHRLNLEACLNVSACGCTPRKLVLTSCVSPPFI